MVFKGFDIFPKTEEDFKVKTLSGGTISVVCLAIISILVISEFFYYLEVERTDELYVDTMAGKKLEIYLNMTFPNIACDVISLDMMDVSGETQLNIEKTVYKRRLDIKTGKALGPYKLHDDEEHLKSGNLELDKKYEELFKKIHKKGYCGSCYGSESKKGQCCNTCDEIKESYRKKGWAFTPKTEVEQCVVDLVKRRHRYNVKEGCNIHGFFLVNKVAGNFHIAPGKTLKNSRVHDFLKYEVEHFNTSHVIHSLGFGEKYPGIHNPLDGVKKFIKTGSGLFQYFIKVVPTIYEHSEKKQIITNQYAVTQHFRPKNRRHANVIPGVFFIYDLSPIMVHITEQGRSFLHFLTSLCAIIGGVFSVAGIIDSLVYKAGQNFKNK